MSLTRSAADDDGPETCPEECPAPARVSFYLERVEAKRRSARKGRLVALGVGAVVAGVAFLTSIGVAPPEARDLVASASAVVVGFALSRG